jgi:hypothetical protein
LPVVLDVEMIREGEGEVAAAKRLLERVFRHYSRFFDVIVGNAIYLEGPFFKFCLDHNKDVLAVLKNNNPALLEDAKAIFSEVKPVVRHKDKRSIRLWDCEGFGACENFPVPLRIIHTRETETPRSRIAGRWENFEDTSCWYWATTLSKSRCPSFVARQAGHHRWDIENDLFNTLVNQFSLNHCFKHDPVAILNFILTLFIAFVLIQSFYQRNLKPQLRRIFNTLISLADELHASLAAASTPARKRPP